MSARSDENQPSGSNDLTLARTSNGGPIEGASSAQMTSNVPVQVVGLTSGVKQISTYFDFACAITAQDGVKCWGADEMGQLGTGIAYTDNRKQASSKPVDVKGLSTGVASLSLGLNSSCVVMTTGTVKCWGKDEGGKLGNDSPKSSGDGNPNFLPPVDAV